MAWRKIYRRKADEAGTWILIFCGQAGKHLCTENKWHRMIPVDFDDAIAVKEETSFMVYNLGDEMAQRPAGDSTRLRTVPSPAAGD